MLLKVYQYANCSTCRKAIKFLDAHSISYTSINITEQQPTRTELRTMLKHLDGNLKRLFNTSGQQYRALDIKSKLSTLTDAEAIELLSQNGMLIKRPFALTEEIGLIGFREDAWREALL